MFIGLRFVLSQSNVLGEVQLSVPGTAVALDSTDEPRKRYVQYHPRSLRSLYCAWYQYSRRNFVVASVHRAQQSDVLSYLVPGRKYLTHERGTAN